MTAIYSEALKMMINVEQNKKVAKFQLLDYINHCSGNCNREYDVRTNTKLNQEKGEISYIKLQDLNLTGTKELETKQNIALNLNTEFINCKLPFQFLDYSNTDISDAVRELSDTVSKMSNCMDETAPEAFQEIIKFINFIVTTKNFCLRRI